MAIDFSSCTHMWWTSPRACYQYCHQELNVPPGGKSGAVWIFSQEMWELLLICVMLRMSLLWGHLVQCKHPPQKKYKNNCLMCDATDVPNNYCGQEWCIASCITTALLFFGQKLALHHISLDEGPLQHLTLTLQHLSFLYSRRTCSVVSVSLVTITIVFSYARLPFQKYKCHC